MSVTELLELLRQCEPSAKVGLVDCTGIYELTGIQQTTDKCSVYLSHASNGFEADRE